MKKRFIDEGLDAALNGKTSEQIYKKKIDGDTEAHLIAMSCSEPPEGFQERQVKAWQNHRNNRNAKVNWHSQMITQELN